MNYKNLVKSLDLPTGYAAPTVLAYDDITARAISRADLVADVNGINSSIEIIQRTRGGGWPTGPVSEEVDYVDLVCGEIIPAAVGLADAVDAFCETIGFSQAQTRRVFAAARAHGLPVKLHADKAYAPRQNRDELRRRGIIPRIARPGIDSSRRLGRLSPTPRLEVRMKSTRYWTSSQWRDGSRSICASARLVFECSR